MSSWHDPPDEERRRDDGASRTHELLLWLLLVLACIAIVATSPAEASLAPTVKRHRCPIVLVGWEDGYKQAPRPFTLVLWPRGCLVPE